MSLLKKFQQLKSELPSGTPAETTVRSFVKGITYRCLGSTVTFILGWIITGSLPQATAISVLEIFSKIFGFAIHDRIWQYIDWGKK